MADEIEKVILQYVTDKNALNQTIQDSERLESQIKDGIGGALGELGPSARVGVSLLRAQFADLRSQSAETQAGVAALGDELDSLSTAQAAAADHAFIDSLRSETLAANEQSTALKELREIRASNAEFGGNFFDDEVSGGGGGGGGRIARFGSELRKLPSIQIPGTGVGTDAVASIIRLGGAANEAVGGVADSLTEFIAIAGPAALAAGTVALAVGVVVNEFKKGADVVGQVLTADQKSLALEIQNNLRTRTETAAQTQQQIDVGRDNLALIYDQIQARSSQIDALRQQEKDNPNVLGNLARNQTINQLSEDLDKLNQQYIDQANALENNTNVILPAVTAREAETAAIQAQVDAEKQRIAQILSSADEQRQNFLDNRQLLEGTAEQARARVQELEDEANANRVAVIALQATGDQSKETTDQIEKYREQIRQEQEDINRINSVYIPLLDAREREIKAHDDAYAAAQQFGNSLVAGIGRLHDFGEATEKLGDKLTESIAKIESERTSGLTNLATKLTDDLGRLHDQYLDSDAKADAQGLEQLRKFHESETQRAKQHQLDLAKIARDGDISIQDNANDRNIRGALEAERGLHNQLKDNQDRFDLDSDAKKVELANLEKNIAAQDKERFRDYTKRYNDLIAQNRKQVDALNAKYDAEIATQRAAYSKQYSDLLSALVGENALRTQANNAVVAGANNMLQRMVSLVNQAQSLLTGGTSTTGSGTRIIDIPTSTTLATDQLYQQGFLTRAKGGSTPSGSLTKLNDGGGLESGINSRGMFGIFSSPTTVFNAQQTRDLLSGVGQGINLDFSGMVIQGGPGMDENVLLSKFEQRVIPKMITAIRSVSGNRGGGVSYAR